MSRPIDPDDIAFDLRFFLDAGHRVGQLVEH